MKKILFTAIAATAITATILSGCSKKSAQYPATGLCVYSQWLGDCAMLTIAMQNGNTFQFASLDGDLFVGDIISVIMDDAGTSRVDDDKIIDCRYSGWLDDITVWFK